jgi:hypothetical protein
LDVSPTDFHSNVPFYRRVILGMGIYIYIQIYRYIEWDATNDSPKRYWYITTFFHKLLKNVVLNGTRWDKT